ncbi:transglycosylase domain-containing protein [Glycomyces sp. NPDC047010]|uniref:transglycosylase domain-containing protein n=1 Tax=Glycomyces sp. NPDC047010 TaxID=3155023 RepID=UPI0033D0C54C
MRRTRAAKPRRRGRRRLIALGLVLAVLTGAAVVVGSVFYASVDLPEDLDAALSQGSTVYYSDGTTVMGELAAERRTSVGLDDIADDVQWALIAAEDAGFYDHPGVDFKGVMRALVNNATGGDRQGASTLTQQYVGMVADIRGDGSYLRKAREAAMAMKMEEAYSKDEILNHYLNIVYFGRGAYGVEAGAQAFFGQSAADLSTSQAALLVAQIKSPDGPYDPRDPYGQGGSVEEATERWNYVLDQMVAIGELDQVKRDALTGLPETLDPTDDPEGLGPEGFVTNGFVLRELAAAGITTDEVMRGGLAITTTLDAELQSVLLDRTGIRDVAADDEALAAAAAAVEPGTGAVLAYYGGENGAGLDLAEDVGHLPGTAFNAVTAAAAIDAGFDPYAEVLDGSSPQRFATYTDEDGNPKDLLNTGGQSVPQTSIVGSVLRKLDTPVYGLAENIGGDTVAAAAEALGISRFWDPHDLDDNGVAAETAPDAGPFQPDIGIGAYPVTVLDMASVYATIASGGTAAEPYFVEEASGADGTEYEAEPQTADSGLSQTALGAVQGPLLDYAWENFDQETGYEVGSNASPTWHVGSSNGLSLAVWAGDETKEGDGSSPQGTLAEHIWWAAMSDRPDDYYYPRADRPGERGAANTDPSAEIEAKQEEEADAESPTQD